jgi:hypothetical protein
MAVGRPRDEQSPEDTKSPEDDTALLTAALDHVWTLYDTHISRVYQVVNYYLVASAVLATAYASALNGKRYSLAAIFSVAGLGLTAIAFGVALSQKRSADGVKPALAALQGKIATKLGIDLSRIVDAEQGNGITRIGLPALLLAALVEVGSLAYALIH